MIIIKAVKNGFPIPPRLYQSDMPEKFRKRSCKVRSLETALKSTARRTKVWIRKCNNAGNRISPVAYFARIDGVSKNLAVGKTNAEKKAIWRGERI